VLKKGETLFNGYVCPKTGKIGVKDQSFFAACIEGHLEYSNLVEIVDWKS